MSVRGISTSHGGPDGLAIKESRKRRENALYAAWLAAKDDPMRREEVLVSLRGALLEHAQAVMYSILRSIDEDALHQAVEKVIVAMPTFRQQSRFTTWAHRIMLGTMYDYRRFQRRHLLVPLDEHPELDLPDSSADYPMNLILDIQASLTAEDREIFEALALQGYTLVEAAECLKVPAETIRRKWNLIRGVLHDALVK